MHTKRDRLIEAASELFYQQGLANTSLAHIAKRADVPIGNVYYYFKTKEELALAAIERRAGVLTRFFEQLEATFTDPRERLMETTRFFERTRDNYAHHGSPLGRIIYDCSSEHESVGKAAAEVMKNFVHWAQAQFHALGHAEDARTLAQSFVARIEGAILLAKALGTPEALSNETTRICEWLERVPNKRIQLGKVSIPAKA